MALSSPGIGSGLDVNGIVTQLTALERKPITQLQSAASFIQTQISAYGKVQSLTSTLRDAAAALAKPTLWQQNSVVSSDTATLAASAGAATQAGIYSVVVTDIARAQSLASTAFGAGTDVIGAGTLTITVAGVAKNVTFTDAGTTLAQWRDGINAAGAGVGAAIVTDASGARLTLRSSATGLANTMQVSASGANLQPFAYPPDGFGIGMDETQAATNAIASVNGLGVESQSNQLAGVLDGVTLNLLKTSATPVTVTVANDVAAQRKAVQDFVAAYNALNGYLAEQTKYDEANKIGGTLQGDNAALLLRSQFRQLLRAEGGASTVYTHLGAIGFDVQRDGTIKLDNTKLDAALANPTEMTKLFANKDLAVPPTKDGLALRFRDLGDTLTRTDGLLTARNEGLQAKLKRNKTDQQRLEERVERTRERLLRQYQALDGRLGQLTNLSNYMTQQLKVLGSGFKSGDD